MITLGILSVDARTQDICAHTRNWDRFQKGFNLLETEEERAAFFAYKEREEANKLAEIVVNSYFSRKTPLYQLSECLPKKDVNKKIYYKISKIILKKLLHRLKNSNLPRLAWLANDIEATIKKEGGFLLDILAHKRNITYPFKGGFHRAKKNVYLNLSLIPPDELVIIFIHEFLHKLDRQITKSSIEFANPELVKSIFEWSNKTERFEQLDHKRQELIRKYIMDGLHRGLLGEYRAWLISFAIYKAGRVNGFFPSPIPWIDAILEQQRKGESLESFVYNYLDVRFVNPTDNEVFKKKLAISSLEVVREELKRSKIPLYDLRKYYPETY